MSLCHCGCGQATPPAKHPHKRGHYKKGGPTWYLPGHSRAPRRVKSPQEVVAEYVRPGDPSDCWPWHGPHNLQGYGIVCINYRQLKAHRLVYEWANGPIPDGLVVRHSCDNPPCVNPEHLLLGTSAENTQDKVDRRRQVYGERVNTARLSEDDVRSILARAARGEPGAALAERFGVSHSAVRHILAGRTWKHLAGAA